MPGRSDSYSDALRMGKESGKSFALSPADGYTESVSIELGENLRLITAGPHTERVRSQEACSHSLAAPLKAYLLLRLDPWRKPS